MRVAAMVVLAALAVPLAVAQQPLRPAIPSAPAPPSGGWQDVSLAGYRQHLEALSAVVSACAKARDAKTCDPALVGRDDRVALGEGANVERRPVRYEWLRILLREARKKDAPNAAKKAVKGIGGATIPGASDVLLPSTTTELLRSAEKRLDADQEQADGKTQPEPEHAAQRRAMEQVLAGREFSGLGRTSPVESLKEKIDNWLNSIFARAAGLGARAPWLGRAAVVAFILLVCVGLAWGLLQFERRWRIRLTPESMAPRHDASSARGWQLWLEDARAAAGAGLWREAIHCVYWAAISHLESRRLLPADRARTPREYLASLVSEDPRHPGLAALTGSFERTWYGGRAAGEGEYKRAEELATGLIDRPAVSTRAAAQ